MSKELTQEDLIALKEGVSNIIQGLATAFARLVEWASPVLAELAAMNLERQGRECRDRRKRNRYFRRAKRLRAQFPL